MLIPKIALLCFKNCLGSEWLGFPSLIRIRSCWTEILFPMNHPSQKAEPTPQIFPLSWPKILAFYQTFCDSISRQKCQKNSRNLHTAFKDPSSTLSSWERSLWQTEEQQKFCYWLLPLKNLRGTAQNNLRFPQIEATKLLWKRQKASHMERGSSRTFLKDFWLFQLEDWKLDFKHEYRIINRERTISSSK